jgi:hypothetical protein
VNIYEFFRLLVKSSGDMPNKDAAYELIDRLESLNTFGTSGLEQVDGKGHDHIKETAQYVDGIRLVDRCALCHVELAAPYFPPQNPGKRW